MARKGPVTTDTSAAAVGMAQIRVGPSTANIGNPHPVLVAANSIGALAKTSYKGNTDWLKLESGFPALEDYVVAIREAASLECAFKQISPYNMALAHGLDPTGGTYASAHSGEVAIGGRTAPVNVRMEAVYTYPNGTNRMIIIFPRAQISSAVEMDLPQEEWANVPITFEAKRADSETSGGAGCWDTQPLGKIKWDALG